MRDWNPGDRVFLWVILLRVVDDDTSRHWAIVHAKEQIAELLRLLPDTCGKGRMSRDGLQELIAAGTNRIDIDVVTDHDWSRNTQRSVNDSCLRSESR